MKRLLIALVLLTLSFPSLAWTSSTLMEGAKGTERFDPATGKKGVTFFFSTKLTARSAHPHKNFPGLDHGPSVEFLPAGWNCNPFEHQPGKSVKIQGTMVRMRVSCPNSGQGLSMWPSSEAGIKFVFNTFKARNQVTFEADTKLFCGHSSAGSCMFKIDASDFNVIEEEAFSGGL